MENFNNPEIKKTEKEERWEEAARRIDTAIDKRGKKIDGGIKDTIIALSLLGVNTTASCEGHLDHKTGAPYIDVKTTHVEEFEEKLKHAPTKEEAQAILKELERGNLEESEKVMDLLEEFYQDRDVPYYRRIIVNPRARYWSRLESQGTALQEIKTGEVKERRLKEFQQEMKDFTQFLKKKFFSES